MSHSEQVINSFLHVPNSRPVLVFDSVKHAAAFIKAYKGAETYDLNSKYVYLPTPHGLDMAMTSKNGKMAYCK